VPLAIRGAVAALVVFDVASPESFASAQDVWVPTLSAPTEEGKCPVILFGNKTDLTRVVTKSAAVGYCEANGLTYMEGSAKTGDAISVAFEKLAQFCAAASEPQAWAGPQAAQGRGCC
jgi:GTPase SAR1 family protein